MTRILRFVAPFSLCEKGWEEGLADAGWKAKSLSPTLSQREREQDENAARKRDDDRYTADI